MYRPTPTVIGIVGCCCLLGALCLRGALLLIESQAAPWRIAVLAVCALVMLALACGYLAAPAAGRKERDR